MVDSNSCEIFKEPYVIKIEPEGPVSIIVMSKIILQKVYTYFLNLATL